MSEHSVIGTVSYNGKGGFTFSDEGDLVRFSNRQYECTVRKDAINAVEYTVFRNLPALFYAIFVGAVFVLGGYVIPGPIIDSLRGEQGPTEQLITGGFALSGLVGVLIYLYPNSKLVVHAGSYKCVVDGQNEKLIRIATRLHT